MSNDVQLYHVDSGTVVLATSISDLAIGTQDADDSGYLRSDGTNRSLRHGISPDGTHVIWMSTNGGDIPVWDEIEAAREWCQDMGDDGDDDDDRIETGAERLLEAVATLRTRYAHNEAALDQLDWYADKAAEVLDSIDTE